MGKGKKRWNVRTTIVWDVERNVPTFKDTCWDCNYVELPMTDPGDARPSFEADRQLLVQTLEEEFGAGNYVDEIVGEGDFLLNKGAGLDDFREIFSRGTIVGKLYWDVLRSKWRFRPSYAAVKVLIENDLIKKVEVNDYPKEGTNIFANCEEDKYVAVTLNGEPIGIGYCRKNGRVRVVTTFPKELYGKEPFPAPNKRTTIEDWVKFNELRTRMVVSQAEKFLYQMIEKVKKPVTVSFSGGKDSLVSLHLTLKFADPLVIFNDTGIELPETIETVKKVVSKFNLKLVTASAGDDFWHAARMVGPPARDFRWCCKVTKLVPMAKLAKEMWPSGALNVVGQRIFESIERSRSPRVWRNKWFPHILNISPIHEWTQLDVWFYIYRNSLLDLVNPLYFKGFERIGCFMCPASPLAEFEVTKNLHPELMRKWEEILEIWRKRLGLPEEWVKYGLWRWLSPSSKKRSLMRTIGIEYDPWLEFKGRLHPPFDKEVKVNSVKLRFKSLISLALEDQESVIGDRGEDNKISSDGYVVTYDKNEVKIEGERAIEGAIEVSALIYRWFKCMRCKSCEVWCPTGSIKVETRPKVNRETCINCKLCLLECPMYEPFADRVVSAVILERFDAWKRPTKPLRKEVLKELKNAVLRSHEELPLKDGASELGGF